MNIRNIKDFTIVKQQTDILTDIPNPIEEVTKNMLNVIEKQCKAMLEAEGVNCEGLNAENIEEFKQSLSSQGYELLNKPVVLGIFDSVYELRHNGKVKSCFYVMMKDSTIKITSILPSVEFSFINKQSTI